MTTGVNGKHALLALSLALTLGACSAAAVPSGASNAFISEAKFQALAATAAGRI